MSQPLRVDLNADVGESFGARRKGDDEPIFAYVTSANVACGFHAGDPSVIAATLEAAARHRVAVGAHPSYPDQAGFGRRTVDVSADDLRQALIYQIGAVGALARTLGVRLVHVKPHGALYNDAAKNAALAATIADAVAAYDRQLILVGLAGSHMLVAGKAAGLRVAAEAFCDRVYEADGTLRNRSHPDAVIEDPERAARQAVDIVIRGHVRAVNGVAIGVRAHSLCVHGDSKNSVETAAAIRAALKRSGADVVALATIV
jgi:UPF0271 protein